MLPKNGSQTVMQGVWRYAQSSTPTAAPCAGEQDPLPRFEKNSICSILYTRYHFQETHLRMTIQRHLKGLATKTAFPAVQRWAVPLPPALENCCPFNLVKKPSARAGDKVQSLGGRKIPWRRKMAAHSSLLALRNPR